jgi:hypothetical protein
MTEGRAMSVGKYLTRPLEAATKLIVDNLVLSIDSSGDLILCTNTATPYAIASRSTQKKIARTVGIVDYDVGADIAPIPVFRSGLADLPLGSTNVAIKVGDAIYCHADDDGTVNGGSAPTDTSEQLLLVGYAEQVVGANAGGTVLTALAIRAGCGGP